MSWRTQRTDGGTVVAADFAFSRDPAVGLPEVTLAVEHYNRMARLIDAACRCASSSNLRCGGHPKTFPDGFNIVGELPGTDKADEVVLVGAHFDSFHGATGATDNAAGVDGDDGGAQSSEGGRASGRAVRSGLDCGVTKKSGQRWVPRRTSRDHLGHPRGSPCRRWRSCRRTSTSITGPVGSAACGPSAMPRAADFRSLERTTQGPWREISIPRWGGAERPPAVRGDGCSRVSVRAGAL